MFEVLTVGAFVIACALALVSPRWALALVLTMYPFEQALQASSSIFLRILPLANVIVALVVGIGTLRAIASQNRPFLGYASLTWIGVVLIFTWTAVSLLWTPAFGPGSELTKSGLPYFALFLLVAPLLIDEIESVEKMLSAFLLLGVVIIILILINPAFTFYSGRLGVNLDARVRTNPLAMGELGGSVMLIAALYRMGARSIALNLLRLAGFFLGAILALQSGSRGQVVFAVLIAVVFYPLSTKVKNILGFVWTALGLLILIPAVLFIAQQLLGSAELRRWDSDVIAGGTEVRLANALDLLKAFAKDPLAWFIGLGFNAFVSKTSASTEPYSHVMFVDILAELGIPAFCLFAAVCTRVGKDSLWLFRRFADDPAGRASISVVFALLGYQVLLVNKQGYLWAASFFFLLFVMIARLRQRTEEADYDRSSMLEAETEFAESTQN